MRWLTAIGSGAIMSLFLGWHIWGSEANVTSPTKVPLMKYLQDVGIQLDCYFTIEEDAPVGAGLASVNASVAKENVRSVDDAVNLLKRSLPGWSISRNERNPVVINLVVPSRWVSAQTWASRKVIAEDCGHETEVFRRLLRKATDNRVSYGGGSGGVDIHRAMMRVVKVHAVDIDLRTAITASIPYSACQRVLWHAIASGTEENVRIQIAVGWDERAEEQTTGRTEIIPFSQGESAYRGNPPTKEVISQVINYIDEQLNGGRVQQVRWAMLFLGKVKAQEGIPLLLRHIQFEYAPSNWLEEAYPAILALSKMGKPGSAAALKALPAETDGLRLKLLCRIILLVEGQEAGTKTLESEIAKTADAQQQQRIRDALKAIAEPQAVPKR